MTDPARLETFRRALQALLPQGLLWPRPSAAGVREKLLSGLAEGSVEVVDRAADLLRESDPRTTVEMIRDWEEALGLPEVAVPDDQQPTLDERRAAVVSKLVAVRGAAVQDLIDEAADVGFIVEIFEYSSVAPFRAGSHAGDSCWDQEWRFFFLVIAPAASVRRFHAGSLAGDRLATWSNVPLETLFARIRPAWTKNGFSYTP